MAENDQYNDEYHLADLDVMSPDDLGGESTLERDDSASNKQARDASTHVRRNALIVVGLVILSMLVYKFIGVFTAGKKTSTEMANITPLQPQAQAPAPTPAPIQQAPQPIAQQQVQPQPAAEGSQFSQKLSSLEAGQQDVRSEVNSVSNQLGGISSNVNDLTDKIAQLNQMVATLAAKVDQQSNQIGVLTERTKPKPVPHRVATKKGARGPNYYLQAVIPGRAWLIATNGSTLTVREGTQIVGYGVVKLIDPNQGRVITSSGRVIRFSQQDS